jgi:CubicO group peptidase (beta-lactamase class C family)
MSELQGFSSAQFEPLKKLLAEKLESGEELGASIVINIDGKNVVDLWGGYSDEAKSKPWSEDTITNVWSSTKTVAAFATLLLHERGLLSVDEPVAKYWPEFAENGKEKILVRHLLSHTSGVSGWEETITAEQAADLSHSIPLLAKQAPWWEPGTASGYHMLNFGHLLGEVVRRVTGKPMKEFVASEIAGPLNADFQVGLLDKDLPRVSDVIPPPPMDIDFSQIPAGSPAAKTFPNPVLDAQAANKEWWRHADMSGANGHTNARGINRILSTISNGGTVDGKKWFSQNTIDTIFRQQSNGPDLIVGVPLNFGIGYGISGPATSQGVPWIPQGKVAFWGGYGGSWEIMDVDRKVTFTYVMNKMGLGVLGNSRTVEYVQLAWKLLENAQGEPKLPVV